ncbi:MAG: transcription termination factor NusA [Candidatus Omnitrophica bacterium]|nr:transcription termination factor NusA [Candidatus Omnitrophota bacterium]MBU4345985.1 transcription termination factor NusA [Candidatus Omnitrophota bacterium]MBU4472821.1 transcription termination factor NusA [Candidatus Omnitrophota bacterium]MCG2706014.1 transcription termination factor NusA [Candidatus Omnitrophota bacterium]
MSQELLTIIDQIEREKGIKKEILIEAIESALLAAARKVVNIKSDDKLKIELDRKTGQIKAFKNEKEITTIDFGRIAASTARQVIIQKIREAEKEVVFREFQGKAGEIISGGVYRFDKNNIIVDLLGKAEGILLKREQSPREEFKMGQPIRVYVVEVKRDTRGPQIMLSRTHPNLVKKLFELEVPEIYEGIVEIKSMARQPGERTKIAVRSKNEKVDSVGACVGMRGNRVRNIVNELQGEKIDIVRYSDDIKEYIKAALSPAKVSEIKLDKERLRAEVIVDDDQLSLAIGRHGQNVRLASKLVSWELDIRSKTTVAVEVEKEKEKEKGKAAVLAKIPGIGEKTLAVFKESGLSSIEDILKSDIKGLTKIKGIGKKKAQQLIKEAKKLASK